MFTRNCYNAEIVLHVKISWDDFVTIFNIVLSRKLIYKFDEKIEKKLHQTQKISIKQFL